MGCSSSNVVTEPDIVIQSEIIKREWKIYSEIKQKIESLLNDINSKFRDDFYELMDSVLFEDTFFNRYEQLLYLNNLTRNDIKNYILEIELITNMCKDHYLEYDIHLIIMDCQEKLFPSLSQKNKNELKILLQKNKHIFPTIQRGIYFQIQESNKTNEQLRYTKILKYNDKYNNMSVLTIKMNTKLRNYMVLEEASEIISCNVSLITICLYLQFDEEFNLDIEEYRLFFECFIFFIENVRAHKNLKTFVLIFEDNNYYNFPSSFYDNLFGIINKRNIIALVLVGITFSNQELLNKLCECLEQNKYLQFLLLHFIDPIHCIIYQLCLSLSSNKDLSMFSLSGGKLKPKQVKDIYSKLSHLKVFNYKTDFFVV